MCISPIMVKVKHRSKYHSDMKNGAGLAEPRPCHKCHECLGRRRNAWAFRLHHQMNVSESSCFLTLTYGEVYEKGKYLYGENPPLTENGLETLNRFKNF